MAPTIHTISIGLFNRYWVHDQGWILVDTGIPFTAGRVARALRSLGVPPLQQQHPAVEVRRGQTGLQGLREGLERLPRRGPLVLAANHASYADVAAVLALVPWTYGASFRNDIVAGCSKGSGEVPGAPL